MYRYSPDYIYKARGCRTWLMIKEEQRGIIFNEGFENTTVFLYNENYHEGRHKRDWFDSGSRVAANEEYPRLMKAPLAPPLLAVLLRSTLE